MAQQLDPLLQAITQSAQAKLAPAGGYGQRSFLGSIADIVAPALAAAFPNGPLPQALNAGRQAFNTRAYNRYLVDQATQQKDILKAQRQGNKELYTAALGADRAAGMPGLEYVDPEGFSKVAPSIGNTDFGNASTALQQGRLPASYGMAPADQVGSTVRALLERQGKVADYGEAQGQANPLFGQGQQGSSVNGPITGTNVGRGIMSQMQQPAGLDDGTGGQGISTGIQREVVPPQTVSPFLRPAIDPQQVFGQYQAGAKDRQEKGQQDNTGYANQTTRQHYERDDKLNEKIYKATKANQGGYARYAPAGPASPQPNEASRAYDAWRNGVITDQQYAETLGAGKGKTEKSAIQGKIEGLKQLSAIYGKDSPQVEAARQEIQSSMNQETVNSLDLGRGARTLTNNAVSRFVNGLNSNPFGGSGRQNLQKVPGEVRGTRGTYKF